MTTFQNFHASSPISEATIDRFAPQVPAEVVSMWRSHGTGFVGPDWFFRVVDPGRAADMLAGVLALPARATVLFTTALGDVIAHSNGMFWVVKARFGATDIVQGIGFRELVRHIEDPAQRQAAWEWDPYPAAVARTGVPSLEQCLGFTPLLTRGGSNTADSLQLGGLYEHLAVVAQLAGAPQVRRLVEFAVPQAAPAPRPTVPSAASTSSSSTATRPTPVTSAASSATATRATALRSVPTGSSVSSGSSYSSGSSSAAATPTYDKNRLIAIGQTLFTRLVGQAQLGVLDLPGGLGVCVVHQERGGGKIYVAPDESVLFVSSAADFQTGLGAFRDGIRTPLEKFGIV